VPDVVNSAESGTSTARSADEHVAETRRSTKGKRRAIAGLDILSRRVRASVQ
jgi:hypothetical protein